MTERLQTVSPIDGRVVVECDWATSNEVDTALSSAEAAFKGWREEPIKSRIAALRRFVDAAVEDEDAITNELALQIGRPVRFGPGEVRGWRERGHKMLDLAEEALTDVTLPDKQGFSRFIRREPLGTVLVLAPWNYPWLTAVNAVVPALAAGNAVILKHSDQTPLVADRIAAAAESAGLPKGVLQRLHMRHGQIPQMLRDPRVAFVAFTGSVDGGIAVQSALSNRTAGLALELGGKDPAYVCADAPIEKTAAELSEGAFFNSGQSCCAVERIYAHERIYDELVDALVHEAGKLHLGDPLAPETTLGPVVRVTNAENIQRQVQQAIDGGAQAHLSDAQFPESGRGLPYLAPQILTNVDHTMAVMTEETFGPVVSVMAVRNDEEALVRMNDSRYGLTASIWTTDLERAAALGHKIETGTVFMNRCDVLDPELAWVGVKDSGRGCTLSSLGYLQLTRPKSFHLRHRLG